MKTITGDDIAGMVEHWLSTPVNGYLGSGYGQDLPSLLQRPHSDGAADGFMRKMREDVQILTALPGDAVTLYGQPVGVDRLDIVLEVTGKTYNLSEADQ